jgi:hypothetical protein
MVEDGALHPNLKKVTATSWGRRWPAEPWCRSAVGLDERGEVLTGWATAPTRAMAKGMQHAGAYSVAQLDINWSSLHT